MKLLAQTVNLNGTTINGPLKSDIKDIGSLVTTVLNFLLPLAAVVLLFVLIWGGFDYMMSQGNAEKIKAAQAKITTGIIGFVLLISSYLIARLIATIFGLGTGIL